MKKARREAPMGLLRRAITHGRGGRPRLAGSGLQQPQRCVARCAPPMNLTKTNLAFPYPYVTFSL